MRVYWPPLPRADRCFKLHEIAPRLARARDSLVLQRREERKERTMARDALYAAERTLAHRELQLVRAQNSGRRRYIIERERKLKDIRLELDRAVTRLAAAESPRA